MRYLLESMEKAYLTRFKDSKYVICVTYWWRNLFCRWKFQVLFCGSMLRLLLWQVSCLPGALFCMWMPYIMNIQTTGILNLFCSEVDMFKERAIMFSYVQNRSIYIILKQDNSQSRIYVPWYQESTNFPDILEPPPNCRHQKGNMRQVPCWGPIILKWPAHHTIIWCFLLCACELMHVFLCKGGKCNNCAKNIGCQNVVVQVLRHLEFVRPCMIQVGNKIVHE
jgi:hypothetical protein